MLKIWPAISPASKSHPWPQRLDTFVEGRVLDDNATVMVEYDSGAKGVYWISQIAVGHDNDLRISIYGTKGSLEWAQEDPNYLKVAYIGKPTPDAFTRTR